MYLFVNTQQMNEVIRHPIVSRAGLSKDKDFKTCSFWKIGFTSKVAGIPIKHQNLWFNSGQPHDVLNAIVPNKSTGGLATMTIVCAIANEMLSLYHSSILLVR